MAPQRNRLLYIDATRGLLFCLMTLAHALTLADMPDGLLRQGHLLVRGISTTAFIVLSGFSVALVFPWGEDRQTTARRVRRRAGQLLAVMFVSNVIMLTLNHAAYGKLELLSRPEWWLGLLTLETPYSISGILLPIAVFLLAAPLAGAVGQRHGLGALLAVTAALVLLAWLAQAELVRWFPDSHIVDVLFRTGAGGFPVVPMASLGAAGFALGFVWQEAGSRARLCLVGAGVAALVGLRTLIADVPSELARECLVPGLVIGRFLLLLAIGLALTGFGPLSTLFGFLPVLGRYALFSFLLHRVVLQALVLGTRQLGDLPTGDVLVAFYVAGTLGTVTLFCFLRQRSARYDRALKRICL